MSAAGGTPTCERDRAKIDTSEVPDGTMLLVASASMPDGEVVTGDVEVTVDNASSTPPSSGGRGGGPKR
jgi:hypothetical protein